MSKIIRGEDVADCEAWQVPNMQDTGKGRTSPVTARQLENVHEQARREGYQRGMQQGRAAGSKDYQEKIRQLGLLMSSMCQPLQSIDKQAEEQVAQLAMLVARQIVRRELQMDPGQVVGVVREALALLPVSALCVRVALNPQDAGLVREALALHDDDERIQLVDDPVQSRGGCRIMTENSQIDATVESRLNAVIANVLGGQRGSDSVE